VVVLPGVQPVYSKVKKEVGFKNPAGGKSRLEIYVTGTTPHLLIELKRDGDHGYAHEALWQLFQVSEILKLDGIATVRLAVFGKRIVDPLMREVAGPERRRVHRARTRFDAVVLMTG
jgi:hypothetical protein